MTIQWTEELVESIETAIVAGDSIASICGSNLFPHPESTFWRHFAKDADFASLITRAMEIRTEREMANLITLADTANEDNANAVKLKVWTRMWVAGKLKPKKYGDNAKLQLTGEDGGPLVVKHIGSDGECPEK